MADKLPATTLCNDSSPVFWVNPVIPTIVQAVAGLPPISGHPQGHWAFLKSAKGRSFGWPSASVYGLRSAD
jgi:hypothetical protein